MWGQDGREADLSPRSDRVSGKLNIALPRVLTTGMTPWRFQGAPSANPHNSGSFLGHRSRRSGAGEAGEEKRKETAESLFRGCRRRRSRGGCWRWCRRDCGGPSGGRRRLGRGGRLRLGRRIDPAGRNAPGKAIGHFVMDLVEEPHQAAERRLDVAAGTAEPVIEVEVAKRGIEIVAPHQHHDAATEPDAFGIAGRAVDGLLGLDKLVGLALVVFGSIRRIGIGWLAGLVLSADIAALGKGAAETKQKC